MSRKRRSKTAEREVCREAVMFRDHDYGALAVGLGQGVLHIADNGLVREDADALMQAVRRYARKVSESTFKIDPDCYPASVMSTLVSEMRVRGYEEDSLAEKAISRVPFEEARRPDLPARGKVLVHEAVERGIRQHVQMAVAALRERHNCSEASIKYFPRPNAAGVMGSRPPFAVARMFATGSAVDVRRTVLEALDPIRKHLVKATAIPTDEGQVAVEVGMALPADTCEAFLEDAVPTFQHRNITGIREVTVRLDTPFDTDERADIEELCRGCTGALRLHEEGDGNTVTLAVPSSFVGNYMADAALQERLSWLSGVLEPWGPDITDISELKEMDVSPEAREASLAEFRWPWSREEPATKQGIGGVTVPADKLSAMDYFHKSDVMDKLGSDPNELALYIAQWMESRPTTPLPWQVENKIYSILVDEPLDWKRADPSMSPADRDAVKRIYHKAMKVRDKTGAIYKDPRGYPGRGKKLFRGRPIPEGVMYDLTPGANAILRRFSTMPKSFFETPKGKEVVSKAINTVKEEDGEAVAKKFEEQLDLLKATAMESAEEEAPGMLGRTFVKAAGTFKPAQAATAVKPAGDYGSDSDEDEPQEEG